MTEFSRVLTAVVAFLVFALPARSTSAMPAAAPSSAWHDVVQMTAARMEHTATLLPNGKVLVVGGGGCSSDYSSPSGPKVSCSSELYDSVTHGWSVAAPIQGTRIGHSATLLADGRVLVAGGFGCQDASFCTSAELYDPATGKWSTTRSMSIARFFHTATLLPDGKVLVAGGWGCSGGVCGLSSAELYDPVNERWQVTGSMHNGRYFHTATLLTDGQVLVAGGEGCLPSHICASAELYDPASGTWRLTGSMSVPREEHTATLLRDGQVLVAGGYGCLPLNVCASAELYDPSTGRWRPTGSMRQSRAGQTATLLPDGDVVVAGGYGCNRHGCRHLRSAELYNPATGKWQPAGNMSQPDDYQTATLLGDGTVLVTGGSVRCRPKTGCAASRTAELYEPGSGAPNASSGRRASASSSTGALQCSITPVDQYASDPSGIHWIGFMHGELPHTHGWMPDGGIDKMAWVDAHDAPLSGDEIVGQNLSLGPRAPQRVIHNGHPIFPQPGCWRLTLRSGRAIRRVTMLVLGD